MSNSNFPDFSLPEFHMPNMSPLLSKPVVIDGPVNHMWADEQFKILRNYIMNFEKSLDAEHEVGIWLTHLGHSVLMQVTEIRCEEPVLMVFKGYVDGREATLIQHINQLNFLLTSIPKEPDRPKRKIGFSNEE